MIINSKLLKGMLAVVAAKKGFRSYFQGVHISEKVIEASNGYYMFRADIEGGEERVFTLIGTVPSRSVSTELDFTAKLATHFGANKRVVGTSSIVDFQMSFPNCMQVVKEFDDSPAPFPASFVVNILWLGLPSKCFKATDARFDFSEKNKMMRITFTTDNLHETVMYIVLVKN